MKKGYLSRIAIAKFSLFCVLLFITSFVTPAFSAEGTTDPEKKDGKKEKEVAAPTYKTTRSFGALADYEVAPETVREQYYYPENFLTPASEDQDEIKKKIESTYQKIFEENRFVEFLDDNALLDLPVGIKADIGVLTYTILIDSVVMTPRESFLYASMRFDTPEGKKLYFKGADIKFSSTGGLTGDAKLMLVGDHPINLDGDNSQLIIKGSNNRTFVEFDCRGYKQLSLDGSLVFSTNLVEPEDNKGNVIPNTNLAIDFTTSIVDWNDIVVAVNIPRFRVTKLENVSFEVSDAVLDFSDSRNPPSVVFPQGYADRSPLFIEGNVNLWRGVYIRELTVTLPPEFETKDEEGNIQEGTGHRVSFKGNNLIMDNLGFTGTVSANNLIPIEKGKIGNWDFSLDKIYVSIAANEIQEGGFAGKINIPLNSKAKAEANEEEQKKGLFTYNAVIKKNNEYLFKVSNATKQEFNLWKADVTLHPSSYIEIKLAEGKFRPKAHLNGEMSMKVGLKNGEASENEDKNAKLAKLTFQGLEVQTVKPYVKVGSFSLGTEGGSSKMGGFPIRVNEIFGAQSGNDIILGIDVTLALIKSDDGGFAADGRFKLHAESFENGRDLSYRFKKIEIERFGINIDKGAFAFKGNLNFFNEDPVYGNGISGTVDAEFKPTLKIQASAIFGTKDNKRYWYVDGLAAFNSGLTVFPGVAFYAFGGGAYYHMKIDDQGVGSALGRTASGMVYVPDESVGFGLKATIALGVQPGKKAFNADATFEMAFNTGGGLKYINFRGNGYFMTQPVSFDASKIQKQATKLASLSKKAGAGGVNEKPELAEELYGSAADAGSRAQVWASVMINYDFDNRILHGNLKAYVNVAQGVIKGAGAGGLAGEAVLHFAPNEWYIYIGRPEYENRFAIEVLGLARLDAYFVIGTSIPDSPPPPDNVSSILGDIDLDYMKELNALSDGAGVGFGASFRVDTGDLTFLMFYGRFAAGLGFDIMLKNYGDAQCKGRGALGVNGWYANGQAYAYFEGKIGIKVKIFRKRKSIDILEVGAAVVAQAKLPNPVWVKGIAGGYFSVLGGLVKGRCKFEIEIGEECELIQDGGSPLESIEVLAQATPGDLSKDVDVFTVPQAVFNFEMEKEYQMVDVNDNVVKFKISLDDFAVKLNGNRLTADIRWSEDGTVAALNPFEILPSEKDLVLEIVTSFKEKKSGSWVVTTVDGEKLTEKHTFKFTTGKAPDYIPEHNVAYSYPTAKQYNYYKDENYNGYITLKQGQSYLFESSNEWNQVVRFLPKSGVKVDVALNYVVSAKEVRLTLPRNLVNEQLYEVSVVNVPKGSLQKVDANVKTDSISISVDNANVELSMRTKKAEGTIKEGQEKKLYTSYFRTSKYNTFKEKVTSVNPSSGWRDPIVTGVHAIGSNIGGPEPFSYEEIYGSERNAPLVEMVADLTNVPWYNNQVNPIVYAGYPLLGRFKISEENRDPALLGVVPTKAVYLYQYPYNFQLSEDEIASGSFSYLSTVGRFDYYLAYYMYYDYLDLANQAANYVASGGASSARLQKLITSAFPVIKKGDYWVNINYMLPGKNTVSSTYRHKIHNPID